MSNWVEGDALTPTNLNAKLGLGVFSTQSAVGLTSTSVLSVPVPANTLSDNSMCLSVNARLVGRGSTNVLLQLGSVSIFTFSITNGDPAELNATIRRSGAATQTCYVEGVSQGHSTTQTLSYSATTADLTSLTTIQLKSSSANSFDADHFEVTVVNRP